MSVADQRHALAALAAASGDSLASLSVMLGRNAAYLQQFVKRGTPKRLAEQDRRALAGYFGVGEHVLGAPDAVGAPVRIARLDVGVSAGPGALVDAEVVSGAEMLDPALARRLRLRAEHARVVRVRGTSMMPGLADGDHLFVDASDRSVPAGGAVFVVRVDDVTMVKRVFAGRGGLRVASDNPDSPPVPAGEVTIVGRIVWQTRSLRR